jgi:hypothetical protein
MASFLRDGKESSLKIGDYILYTSDNSCIHFVTGSGAESNRISFRFENNDQRPDTKFPIGRLGKERFADLARLIGITHGLSLREIELGLTTDGSGWAYEFTKPA